MLAAGRGWRSAQSAVKALALGRGERPFEADTRDKLRALEGRTVEGIGLEKKTEQRRGRPPEDLGKTSYLQHLGLNCILAKSIPKIFGKKLATFSNILARFAKILANI